MCVGGVDTILDKRLQGKDVVFDLEEFLCALFCIFMNYFDSFSRDFHYPVKSSHEDIFSRFSKSIDRFLTFTLLDLIEELIQYYIRIPEYWEDCVLVINTEDGFIWDVGDSLHIFTFFHQIVDVH